MYELKFLDPMEIRMGSPFNTATIVLKGSFIPDLSSATFQDKGLVTEDKLICYLIEWEVSLNQPAFRVWRLIEPARNLSKSEIINGCCENISILKDGSVCVQSFQNGRSITLTIKSFS